MEPVVTGRRPVNHGANEDDSERCDDRSDHQPCRYLWLVRQAARLELRRVLVLQRETYVRATRHPAPSLCSLLMLLRHDDADGSAGEPRSPDPHAYLQGGRILD